MTKSFIAWDCETYRILPGILAPPIVVQSFSTERGAWLKRESASFEYMLSERGDEITICGANIAYDFCCLLGMHPELFSAVWELYEQGRVYDVLIAATLNAIGEGRMRDEGHGNELFFRDGARAFEPGSGALRSRYSLSMCVYESLGRADAKENDEWKLRYDELARLPLEQWPVTARQYPLDDAKNTYDVAVAQQTFCNLHDQSAQAHTAFCLQLASVHGLRAEPEAVKEFMLLNEKRVLEMQKTLLAKGLLYPKIATNSGLGKEERKAVRAAIERNDLEVLEPMIGSVIEVSKDTKAIKARIEQALGDLTPSSKSGCTSTERTVLEDSGDPNLAILAEYSKVQTRERYYESLQQAAVGPLNVPTNVLLVTGRSSYSGVVQTFERKGPIRRCFVPRPGFWYCSTDYSGIELSALAQVCLWQVGWSKLADVLNSGKDAHSVFGAEFGGFRYEDFVANKKKAPYEGLRQGGKAANFGFPGGMGEVKFVIAKRREKLILCQLEDPSRVCGVNKLTHYRGKPLDIPVCAKCTEFALKLRQGFFRNWAEVTVYHNKMKDLLQRNNNRVEQYVSKRVRGACKFTSGANTLFQGLAADGFKAAIRELTKRMYMDKRSALYGSRMVLAAHDETLLEVPEDRASDAAAEQSAVMVAEMKKYIPDVLVQAPPALMRRWYKEAEEVRSPTGELLPWEPKETA